MVSGRDHNCQEDKRVQTTHPGRTTRSRTKGIKAGAEADETEEEEETEIEGHPSEYPL